MREGNEFVTPVQELVAESPPERTPAQLLQSVKSAMLRGERGLRDGYLDAGRFAREYRMMRLVEKHSAQAVDDDLRGVLSRHSAQRIKPYDLIAAAEAHRLLDPRDEFRDVSYSHFSREYRKFLERVNRDTPDEIYVLLPGFEEECERVFREGAEADWNLGSTKDHVDQLVGEWRLADNARKQTEREATARDAIAARNAADAKVRAAADAKNELVKITAEVAAASDPATAAKEIDLDSAQAAVAEDAAAARAALDAARQSEKAQVKAAKAAAAAESAVARLTREPKAPKAEKHSPPPLAFTPANIIDYLAKSSENGSARDAADNIAEIVAESVRDLDTLVVILDALSESDSFSKRIKKILKHTIIQLSRSEVPETGIPQNGQLAEVA